ALVQHLFYKTMEKNAPTVLVFRKGTLKVRPWKTYRKILNSAETILYEVLVLISSVVLSIGLLTVLGFGLAGLVAAAAATLINYTYWNVYYYKRLTAVYDVVIDGTDEAFNAAYSKAWFLHSFY